MSGALEGKVCAVTGAANGIGRSIALRLAAEGASVHCGDVDEAALADLVTEVGASGCSASAHAIDVRDREQVEALVKGAVDASGRLDAMYNNAGITMVRRLAEIGDEEFDRLLAVNVKGVLHGIQAAAEQFRSQDEPGTIINTASFASKRPIVNFGAYSVSKAAVMSLTWNAAAELAPDGIRVNGICPGFVQTPMSEAAIAEMEKRGVEPDTSHSILLGRESSPNDVAGLAVFLATPDADYITGQNIQVDGGIVLE